MNIHPHGSSGGDGRRPPRDRNRLGVHDKGASRKSKKRQQRQNQPSQQQSGTAQRANPVFTAADLASEGDSFDVMHDPVILANQMNAAAASAGDTGAQIEAAVAQVLAARAAAQQAAVQQAAAQQAAAMQAAAPRTEAAQSSAPPAPSTSTAPGSSSRHAPRAGASSSDGPFRCPHCSRRYKSFNGVRSHVRVAHDTANVFHCLRCRFTALDQVTLEDHRRVHHDLRVRCQVCGTRLTAAEHPEHVRNCRR